MSCATLSVVLAKSLQDDWMKQNITPIFKSGGSRMMAGNHRLVSLTSIICKIMEPINHKKQHCASSHGVSAHQGITTQFMSSKSCQTNLIAYQDTLTRLDDEGYHVDVLYLDFAKAFDKVPHRRLLLKLEKLGISGCVLQWIDSWLSGRLQ